MAEPFEIKREIELDATPDQVWAAIATGEGLAAWFMPMPMDPGGDMVRVWEPGRHLAIETPPGDDGSANNFEYLIEGRDGGYAVLRFVHSGFLGDDWGDEFETMTGFGWDMYLFTLAQYLRHFPDRPATYIEAEGPAASASADAWPVLLDALGQGAALDVGSTITIDLGAAGLVAGEVDYVKESFIGLRTADALVRFHGRWRIGMTIAVSHHAYGIADAGELTKAWTGWLDEELAEVG